MAKASTLPRIVFWDTAAFVALGNSRDALHDIAVDVSGKLAAESAHILTTDAILIEAVNTFSRAAWRHVAVRLIEAFEQSIRLGGAQLVHVDETLWRRGWNLFVQRGDKDWGLTDCVSFIVMAEQRIDVAFTSDHHFEQAGFQRLMKM